MNKLYEETDIQNIANAIREKTKSTDTFKVSEMANAISNIESGNAETCVFEHQPIDDVVTIACVFEHQLIDVVTIE